MNQENQTKIEPIGNMFCKGSIEIGSGCMRCGRCAVSMASRIADLEAQLSAIGAGGVERLRKRGKDDAGWVDRFFVCRHPAWPDPLQCSSAADAVRAARSPAVSDASQVFIVRERVARTEFHGAEIEAVVAQPSLESLQKSAEVDFSLEAMPPADGFDAIQSEYAKTFGRTPDAAMAETVGKVKDMLLMWWASHREAIAAALQAAPPAPAAVAAPIDNNLLGEIIGCFDAALAEGLMEALLNTRDARLADLVTRRLMHAYYAAIGPSISAPAQEHATQLAGQGAMEVKTRPIIVQGVNVGEFESWTPAAPAAPAQAQEDEQA